MTRVLITAEEVRGQQGQTFQSVTEAWGSVSGLLERIRHLALWRRNSTGRHIATVIVVHHPARLYPEAIIFTTTAP
jgi:hypothetical protein